MVNAITAHTIVNGTRNLILSFNIIADGSGNYVDFPLVNVLDFTGADQRQPNNFKVMKVCGRNGMGTKFQLKFGDTSNNHRLFFESIPEREFDQHWMGGLSTLLSNPDMTVRINTTGFDVADDTISLTLWIKKKRQLDNV